MVFSVEYCYYFYEYFSFIHLIIPNPWIEATNSFI